jgi:ABC-type antimicrobial peptide transport system permease subunit
MVSLKASGPNIVGASSNVTSSIKGGGIPARLICLLIMTGQGMWVNKVQLLLTLLTMAVGSLALSLTYFLGEGARIYLWQDMEQLMGDWVFASAVATQDSHILETRIRPDFTPEDFAFVKDHMKNVRLVERLFQGTKPVAYGSTSRGMVIDGIDLELSREPLYRPAKGRGFSDAGHKVLLWECLLTDSAVKALAVKVEDEPTIFIDGRPFRVKGVTRDPPGVDDVFRARVTVPYGSAQVLWLPPGTIGEILVAWSSLDKMDEVTRDLRAVLDQCRGPGTFFLSSSEFKIQKSRSIVGNFMMYGQVQALFCIGIAFVGVMNVMLTNTSRRSNEFAIRISMGARHYEILTTVLMESFLLGITGALIGVALSAALAPYAGRLLESKINGVNQLVPYYGAKGVLYPLFVCGLAGLIAGVIPALNVRRLDVLSSLRNNG